MQSDQLFKPQAQVQSRWMCVDYPLIENGHAVAPISGSLSIGGWACAYSGVEAIEIHVDGRHLSNASYGMRRPDVYKAHPDIPGSMESGFAVLLPYTVLMVGIRMVEIRLRDKKDNVASVQFSVEIKEIPETDGPWALIKKIALGDKKIVNDMLNRYLVSPYFYIFIPVHRLQQLPKLLISLKSIESQLCKKYSALILVGSLTEKTKITQELSNNGFGRGKLSGFSVNVADSIPLIFRKKIKPDDWVLRMRPGDLLGVDALSSFSLFINNHENCDFFYSDDRRFNFVSDKGDAYFKPGWSPDLLLTSNYIGRAWVAERYLVDAVKENIFNYSDYDLVLRLTESAKSILHLDEVLSEQGDEGDSAAVEIEALKAAVKRRKLSASVHKGRCQGLYRIKRKVEKIHLVSIIIPTSASNSYIEKCIKTLREKTSYRNFEIICVENIPPERNEWKNWLLENVDKIVFDAGFFNWSKFNNMAAQRARGHYLLFLNDDIEVISSDWLDVLLEHAQRPEVGVVGPQLLYANGTVQHAGLALADMGHARHVFRHAKAEDPGYYGLAVAQRNVIGVTGACMLMRREVFDELGGFDETHAVINNDLDFCLKSHAAGYLNVYTPHSVLMHHELASRAKINEVFDAAGFDTRWRYLFLRGDPYFNRNISRYSDDFLPDREPVVSTVSGAPYFSHEEIKSIAVFKLDHIGDCITALPALRLLIENFPKAKVVVVSGKATRPVWSRIEGIHAIEEFNYYNAKSGDGLTNLEEGALDQLENKLSKYDFDLAVDLRKSPDSRHLLRRAGARFNAGFDHGGKFQWLTIAPEWEGDSAYLPKRQHIARDLLYLVSCVIDAGRFTKPVIKLRRGSILRLPKSMKAALRHRCILVHPAVGSEMRQWPASYFSDLINIIINETGSSVFVIGSEAESILIEEVISGVLNEKKIFNVVGFISLEELPEFMALFSLFIGNNSGPQHIAAAVGIPTVGIHSGVVDPNEWGPMGANSFAVQKKMACSPCYYDRAELCSRKMACLTQLTPRDVYHKIEPILKSLI